MRCPPDNCSPGAEPRANSRLPDAPTGKPCGSDFPIEKPTVNSLQVSHLDTKSGAHRTRGDNLPRPDPRVAARIGISARHGTSEYFSCNSQAATLEPSRGPVPGDPRDCSPLAPLRRHRSPHGPGPSVWRPNPGTVRGHLLERLSLGSARPRSGGCADSTAALSGGG